MKRLPHADYVVHRRAGNIGDEALDRRARKSRG